MLLSLTENYFYQLKIPLVQEDKRKLSSVGSKGFISMEFSACRLLWYSGTQQYTNGILRYPSNSAKYFIISLQGGGRAFLLQICIPALLRS